MGKFDSRISILSIWRRRKHLERNQILKHHQFKRVLTSEGNKCTFSYLAVIIITTIVLSILGIFVASMICKRVRFCPLHHSKGSCKYLFRFKISAVLWIRARVFKFLHPILSLVVRDISLSARQFL